MTNRKADQTERQAKWQTERQKKEADRKIDTDIYGRDITIARKPKRQADGQRPKDRQRDTDILTDRSIMIKRQTKIKGLDKDQDTNGKAESDEAKKQTD